jgi:hypothetical protein
MKKSPVSISELDVQPISDEDLKVLSGALPEDGAGSDYWDCTCNSSTWTCYWYPE